MYLTVLFLALLVSGFVANQLASGSGPPAGPIVTSTRYTAGHDAEPTPASKGGSTSPLLNPEEDSPRNSANDHPPTPSCLFFLVRHGQSKPNVIGRVVSGTDGGVDPVNGLTHKGLEQAREAGKGLKQVLLKVGCHPANTMVLTSPFSRARETAEAIGQCLDCDVRQERDLRERWFGDLDGREDKASYGKVWALDAVSARHSEFGIEPASEVAVRAAAVIERVRKEVLVRQRYHTGEGQPFPPGPSAVVLVSHGDTLQKLQCHLAGRPLEQHRSLPHLGNCGIRALRPITENGKTEPQTKTERGERAKQCVQTEVMGLSLMGTGKGDLSETTTMKSARVFRPRAEGSAENSIDITNNT